VNRIDRIKDIIFISSVLLIISQPFCVRAFYFVFLFAASRQSIYEDRRIENISVTFEGTDRAISAAQQFELVARNALGDVYSAVKLRDALDALYKTKRIVSAKIEATPVGDAAVNLRLSSGAKRKPKKFSSTSATPSAIK
jgi:hypothetical protein